MAKNNSLLITFLRSSGMFFMGNILSKAVIFFLLPIYTKHIPPADYGYYDLSITYITLVTSTLFFCIWDIMMRFMYDYSEVKEKFKAIKAGWLIFIVSSFLYTIIAVLAFKCLDVHFLGLILLYGITLNIQLMCSLAARGFGENFLFSISGILNTLIMVAGNIILIVFFHMGYSSLYISSIMGNFIQIAFLIYKLKLLSGVIQSVFDSTLIKKMLRYTLPLCLNTAAYWFLTSYNRIVVNSIMTVTDNGFYAIGSTFGKAITVITTCFTYAWQEIAFSKVEHADGNGSFYSLACKNYMLFLGISVTLILPAFSVVFPIIVHSSYSSVKLTIPLFLITAMVSAYATFIGNIFHALKKTNVIFISVAMSCILNVLISHLFIQYWGLNGANLSIKLSYFLNIGMRAVILKHLIGFAFDLKNFILVSGCICISFIIFINFGRMINLIWFIVSCLSILFLYRNLLLGVVKELFQAVKGRTNI